ncbi:GAF domain-containing protein [Arthrobacter sp. NPDC058130]|uniref:GAF domain-containing protein n=1 Tax=Arthrobacter sp. NPDC058130 TaxID=3346353 RepID=UPI0036E471FB
MTLGTARDGRPDRSASFWELHFNDPDIGAFLSDAVGEFVSDIGGPGRGISWAITLLGSGEALTLTAGSAPARAADEAQRSFDDGPARTAVRSGEFVSVGDTSLDRRWPGYASAAAAFGVRSLLSVPLVPEALFQASVNLYAPWPHLFTSADITAAARLARHVSRALRLVQQLALRSGSGADLSSAQLSRALAGLALRTLVREYGFTEEGALDYLRSVAGGATREAAGGSRGTVGATREAAGGSRATAGGLREAASGTVHVLVPDSVQGPKEPQPGPYAPAPHAADAPPARRRRRRTETPA